MIIEPAQEFEGEANNQQLINAEEIEEWRMRDCYARFLIFNSCDEIRKLALLNSRNSHEMWTRLETQYLQRAADNKHLLHRDFLNLRPTAGEDIMVHITALESMATELNDLGVNVTEHDLITTIMCSLPARFGFLASSWDNIPDNERSMDALRARIVSEQRRIELRRIEEATLPPTTTPDTGALQATGVQRMPFNRNTRGGRGRSSGPREAINRDTAKCTYCGKSRHYEFECRLRIAQQGEKQTTPSKRPNNEDYGGSRSNFSLISVCCSPDGDLNGIVLDSGATRHMCGEFSYFSDLIDIPPHSWPISGIGGKILHAIGVGTIKMTSFVNGSSVEGELKNVLYVPDLGVTLISVACLSINGYSVSFCKEHAYIQRESTIIMTATRSGEGLYKVMATVSRHATIALTADTGPATLNVWHKRLGHVNYQTVRRMANGIGTIGMKISPGSESMDECCHGCEVGKMHKLPFSHSTTKYSSVGECVVSDLVGPMQVNSVGGARYYVLFKDVYSKYKMVYFLKHKSDTANCFLEYTKTLNTSTGHRVKLFRCDGGTEFINSQMRTTLTSLGIKLQTSAPYTPEQNGIAERDHRSTVESARSQIHDRGVPLSLWAEAVNYSVYVLNRTLSKIHSHTPFELWCGMVPDISNLRIFGSVAYMFIPDALRQKLDPKAVKGVYVGESEEQKASRIFVVATGRTHITRHVKVYENLPYWPTSPEPPPSTAQPESTPPVINMDSPEKGVPPPTTPLFVEDPIQQRQVSAPLRKSLRGLIPKKLFPIETFSSYASTPSSPLPMSCYISMALKGSSLYYEPQTYKEAMNGDESALWKLATDREMAAHLKNQTWTLTTLPTGRTCIPSGWNFKVKTDKLGLPCRRKARFFAKGYRQVKGIDYQESFAPVVRYDSLRVIMAITAARNLELIQLDVTTAFLNGLIDELVYIAQPEGYVVPGQEHEVCRLNKGIYGICQASRIWNKTLHDALIQYGLLQSTADPCVYYRITPTCFLIIAVWVDDGLVAGNSMDSIDDIVHYLNRKFEITAVPADLFVGIVITRDRPNNRIYLSIPQFIEKTLTKFRLSDAHPLSLPVLKGSPRLSSYSSPSTPAELTTMADIPFREVVGCIMYAALTVRIDIAFIAGQLAQHCQNPGMDHWKAAQRVLKYLASTRNHGLCFGGNVPSDNTLIGYSDADYAGDPDTRRSTSGYVFILNGGAVTWSSRRQPIVALSTMQSEYIAASDSTREAVWLRRLLGNLGSTQMSPTALRCDNESAIGLAYNPLAHKGSKHIEVRYHYIREQVINKTIELGYVNTCKQIADVLTKAVDGETFASCP